MIIKNILKPTIVKFVILVVLIFITTRIPKIDEQCNMTPHEGVVCYKVNVSGIGYPMFWGEKFSGDSIDVRFNPELFLLNLIVFYSISCLIVFVYKKLKNKPIQ